MKTPLVQAAVPVRACSPPFHELSDEAIGLGLPGNGTTPAVSGARLRLAKEAGKAVMNLVKKNIRPRDVASKAAL